MKGKIMGLFSRKTLEERARVQPKLPIRARPERATVDLHALEKELSGAVPKMPAAVRFREPEKPQRTQADFIRAVGHDTAQAYYKTVDHVADEIERLIEEQRRRVDRVERLGREFIQRIRNQAEEFSNEVTFRYEQIAEAEELLRLLGTKFPKPPKPEVVPFEPSPESPPAEKQGPEA
jgi:hypothetical protein